MIRILRKIVAGIALDSVNINILYYQSHLPFTARGLNALGNVRFFADINGETKDKLEPTIDWNTYIEKRIKENKENLEVFIVSN